MTRLTLAVLLVVGMPGGTQPAPHPRVFVYTVTAPAGPRTDDETGRLAAVDDMREALRKKRAITLVEARAQADVLVEVTSREQRESPAGGFGGRVVTALGDTIIRVHVAAGDEQADLKGLGQGTWGRAARDAAERIVKWIARHEPGAHPAVARRPGAGFTTAAATVRRPR